MPTLLPRRNEEEKPLPQVEEKELPLPPHENKTIPKPEIGDPDNSVIFGKKRIVLKPTKLKYQRDRTAALYRILQQISTVELLAMPDGKLDPKRSNDQMLYEWLIAVTDDPKLVAENYDLIDSATVDRMVHIFCRLNKIKEEDTKKDQAQMTKA